MGVIPGGGQGGSGGGGGGSVSFAAPTVVLGSTAAAGSATTVIASDSTIAAFDATAPSTQALGDSAVVGTVAFAARRDHKHAMPALGTTASAATVANGGGSATTPSKSDHAHGLPPVLVASGASHAAGLAPDPGASAGTVKVLREDASWVIPAQPYVKLAEEQTANTQGGTFTSGAWRTRTLNTKVDSTTSCALASNQFTPVAGTYYLRASAPAGFVARHQTKIRNVTQSTDTLIGTSEYNTAGDSDQTNTRSEVVGAFTANGTDAYELQHQCSTTRATFGFGTAANFGVVEVYGLVELWRTA